MRFGNCTPSNIFDIRPTIVSLLSISRSRLDISGKLYAQALCIAATPIRVNLNPCSEKKLNFA